MGSFDSWARVVGGALDVAGVKGFLSDTGEWLDHSDPQADGWGLHLRTLHELFADRPFTVQEVAEIIDRGLIEPPPVRRDQDGSLPLTLGNAYRSHRGRWFGGCRLDSSATRNAPNGARTSSVTTKSQLSQDTQLSDA
jgi:hypothetical protein